MTQLPASAYVVLGLLDTFGPATPYQLDGMIRESIGYFWGFPRSQLYSEAERLVRRGLVAEQRQTEGRRRRTMSITDAGRDYLRGWLAAPVLVPTELRDLGLLQLFFASCRSDPESAVEKLAVEQARAHRAQLALYEQLLNPASVNDGSPQRATLEMGLRFERLAIQFWTDVQHNPPTNFGAITAPPPQRTQTRETP